jgi:hypothetical protein
MGGRTGAATRAAGFAARGGDVEAGAAFLASYSDPSDVSDVASSAAVDRDGAMAPRNLAYRFASAAFKDPKLATAASSWALEADAFMEAGLAAWGRRGAVRLCVAAYVWVMHVYLFALVFYGGNGPRATNTETATAESLLREGG